jgi:predicted DNA-binding transcriptional regulator YafY
MPQKRRVFEIIQLRHLSEDKPALKIQVHPYFLKEYERYWHLFAWNDEKQCIENYPLDRIQHIKVATGVVFRKPTIEPSTYFEDIIGVTRFENSGVETYRIWVNPIIAAYWRNRKLHASQVEKENVNNGFVFEFKLRWNFEWQNKILYYGKNVEVLEPIKFRNDIQTILKQALTLYEEPTIP